MAGQGMGRQSPSSMLRAEQCLHSRVCCPGYAQMQRADPHRLHQTPQVQHMQNGPSAPRIPAEPSPAHPPAPPSISCCGSLSTGLPCGTCVSKDAQSLQSGGSVLGTREHITQFPVWDMKALARVGNVPGKKEAREGGRKVERKEERERGREVEREGRERGKEGGTPLFLF